MVRLPTVDGVTLLTLVPAATSTLPRPEPKVFKSLTFTAFLALLTSARLPALATFVICLPPLLRPLLVKLTVVVGVPPKKVKPVLFITVLPVVTLPVGPKLTVLAKATLIPPPVSGVSRMLSPLRKLAVLLALVMVLTATPSI